MPLTSEDILKNPAFIAMQAEALKNGHILTNPQPHYLPMKRIPAETIIENGEVFNFPERWGVDFDALRKENALKQDAENAAQKGIFPKDSQ